MMVIPSVPDDGYSECTWWWLFWVYLMMVILSVPGDGCSECTWWWLFWVYLMMVILSVPDDGYSECTWWWLFWVYLMMVILSVPDGGYSEYIWWWLFQKCVVCTKFNIYVFINRPCHATFYITNLLSVGIRSPSSVPSPRLPSIIVLFSPPSSRKYEWPKVL